MKKHFCIYIIPIFLASCSATGHISKTAKQTLLNDPALANAHIGISIYNVEKEQYVYNHQADKYFLPASNTKLFTLYAGLKYLEDSIPGMQYYETEDSLVIYPTGDPTLLHPDFPHQPVIDKLKSTSKAIYIDTTHWKAAALGSGWAWDDFNGKYMPERSVMPVYGNTIKWVQSAENEDAEAFIYSDPEISWPVRFIEDQSVKTFSVKRNKDENYFYIHQGKEPLKEQWVPFVTHGAQSALELLKENIGKTVINPGSVLPHQSLKTIYSQPSDSLFRQMMLTSNNLFAEQILLMVSEKLRGDMNDEGTIDALLKTDLRDIPQVPTWIDGSGLSRYNLFTPQDFVWIINKMNKTFGTGRLKGLFATGGQGTLSNYYRQDSSYIYAKTGSLSGQIALSGFIITRKNKILVFSILVNNHQGNSEAIRRSMESFLTRLRAGKF